jgi:sarcosine oxidase subunit beta
MVDLVPKLSNLKVRRTWRGLYPMTPDGFPIVGPAPGLKGYLLAVGMCGQGFMLGPGLGPLLVRLVQENLTDNDHLVLDGIRPGRHFGTEEKLQ